MVALAFSTPALAVETVPVDMELTQGGRNYQFTVDETGAGGPALVIRGQLSGDAAPFTGSDFDISSRPTTGAAVSWPVPDWTNTGAAGVDQQTADLKTVIQAIVGHQDWASGNALVILVTGDTPSKSNSRIAESRDSGAAVAPVLYVEYVVP